jgi:hypothetical protein
MQRDTSPPSAPLAFYTFMILLTPVTNWEPHCVTLTGYCYAVRQGMKVQIITPYRVSHLQRYGVTVRGNVTSVYPTLRFQGGTMGFKFRTIKIKHYFWKTYGGRKVQIHYSSPPR